MVSLIYHDYNFKFPFTPEYEDGWTSIHKLMTRKLVLQDENEVAINDRHPPVKKTIDAINLLQDAIDGMSKEIYEQFQDEYGLEPDLSKY